MAKLWASLGSLVFLVIAPGTGLVLIPYGITSFVLQPAFFGQEWLRWVGGALIVVGLVPLLDSFARFALQGLGTPAPIAPPSRLVVTGFYRHVRNPMYVGLILAVLGEMLVLSDPVLLWYAIVVGLVTHLFVVIYEEPTLHRMFGEQYEAFRSNVPRWIPRLRPWRQA